ncbi:MAG TPA: phospholipase A [Casimicrobiaceae bacterium]|nr:phospholipase A [Casimicrobiaceae bacterium]
MAQPANANDSAHCAAIADDHARLACYDAAFGHPAPSSLTHSSPTHSSPTSASTHAESVRVPAPTGRLAQPQASLELPPGRSMIGERWSRYDAATGYPFLVRLHNPNYVILRHADRVDATPSSPTHPWTQAPEDIDREELKFQVSFKARVWQSADRALATWLGYTQQSNWQVFNAPQSRPFRETDYEPEIMLVTQPDLPVAGNWRWQLFNLGFVHQSNGRSDPESRNWNRVYGQLGLEDDRFGDGRLALFVRPWLRIHESSTKDDNPDITDYLGYGDVTLLWRRGGQTLTITGRGNARTGKGALELEWSAPAVGPFRVYLQAFTGYGESLIDYNFRQTTFGVGFSLNDLL